jgi:hypothetical protein
LFVAAHGHEKAEAVLVMEPSGAASGNSIELIDWSREGHRLLVAEGFWVWASDAGGIEARIYDADGRKLSREGEFSQAFRRYVGRDCVTYVLPMGFSAAGKAIVAARPNVDEEGAVLEDSCLTKTGIWAVDLESFAIARMRDEFKVKNYGKKRG